MSFVEARPEGVQEGKEQQSKPFGRIVFVDSPGRNTELLQEVLTEVAARVDSYDTVDGVIDALHDPEPVVVVVSGYTLSGKERRTGIDVVRLVRERHPEALGVVTSGIAPRLKTLREVQTLGITIVGRYNDGYKPESNEKEEEKIIVDLKKKEQQRGKKYKDETKQLLLAALENNP